MTDSIKNKEYDATLDNAIMDVVENARHVFEHVCNRCECESCVDCPVLQLKHNITSLRRLRRTKAND